MRAYWAILSARFRMLLQYRAAALAGLGTQLFWGLILVMIYEAFYRSSDLKQPMTYAEVITYVWLGQAMLAMLPWNVDLEVRHIVRSGNVAYELLRPLDLYTHWYFRALSLRTAPTVLRAAPMFLVAMLFFGMQPPASVTSAAAWLVSMIAALLLGCALTNLMNVSLLWTVSGDGVIHLVPAALLVMSGMIVPLPLMPDWAQSVLSVLPFRGVVDVPFRLYVGHLPPARLPLLLTHQLGWTAALIALGRWLMARGTRRLVVQGG